MEALLLQLLKSGWKESDADKTEPPPHTQARYQYVSRYVCTIETLFCRVSVFMTDNILDRGPFVVFGFEKADSALQQKAPRWREEIDAAGFKHSGTARDTARMSLAWMGEQIRPAILCFWVSRSVWYASYGLCLYPRRERGRKEWRRMASMYATA
jgi:hypothetical protein